MDRTECFLILGLEPTKDERLIKNAYREKLAVTNPEDDPEGFKRLRAAYEAACAYARRGDEERKEPERDTTPSGLWVEKAAEIYANIKSRQDAELWRELFKDDIFQSLEEEENCRLKLLRFLMEHFRLPTEIWKLLAEKLSLAKDAGKLRETFPVDFINYVASRCEQGEDIEFALFEGADDAPYDLFLHYYDECWQVLREEKWDEAARLMEEAAGLRIRHPAMEVCRGHLLYGRGERDEAVKFMRALRERYPDDLMVGYNAAEILWKYGDKDGAADVFLWIKAGNEKHYMANVRLTEWNYEKGEYDEAKKCAENVLSAGAGDAFMEMLTKINAKLEGDLEIRWREDGDWEAGLELAWCYLQDGKTSRGIRLAHAIENLVSREREAEHAGLLAKLLIEEAEYEEAIRMADVWEEFLNKKILTDEPDEEKEKDRDRIRQAYMIRTQSYKILGYREKAIAQVEAMETGTPRDIGLWLEKAQIYMEMEEYEKCLEITERLIREYQIYVAAATAMDAYRKQWDGGGVVQSARICIQNFPSFVKAYESLGKVYLDLKDKDALRELLAEAEKNEIKSPYLDAYRFQLDKQLPDVEVLNRQMEEFQRSFQSKVEEGQMAFYEKGLPVINKYLNWAPSPYMLRRRAAFHEAGRQFLKALEDYEKALEEEPANPYIHNGMGHVYVRLGDYEQALVSVKKAILYGEAEWVKGLYPFLGRIYMLLEDPERALNWFQACEGQERGGDGYLRDMVECLARLGRTDEAVDRLTRHYRLENGSFKVGYYRELANVYSTVGDGERWRQCLEAWEREQPKESLLFSPFLPRAFRRRRMSEDGTDYYNRAAWKALFEGDGVTALRLLEKQVLLGELKNGADSEEGLGDMVFAAILHGDDKLGMKYSAKLKSWLIKSSYRAVDDYYHRPKMRLMQEFLADYYTSDDERLQGILDREEDCAVCSFCVMPRCQELEGARVLLLLRQGRREEAKERMTRNLETQPYDEYVRAILPVLE